MPPPELPLPAPPLQPLAPPPQAAQFNVPGSGSGPSLPALGVSTKHGYASPVTNSGAYPRYDDAVHSDVLLAPNRRPLFIGLGIVIAGVIVMLIVSFGGGSDEPAPAKPVEEPTQPTQPATEHSSETQDQPSAAKGSDEVADENMVSVVIHSDPAGADVMIAGTKIGTTPFESKLKRGTKIAQLTVQKSGFSPFNGKIDLGGEYENRNIKLTPLEDMAKGSDDAAETATASEKGSAEAATKVAPKPPVEKTTPPRTKPQPKTTAAPPPKKEKKDEKKEEKQEEKAKCQPPGPNVDPFGLPVCKS
jgi:hypothetical protein